MADRISLPDVTAHLLAERGHDGESWPWTVRFLEMADRQFGAAWTRTVLPGPTARAVVIPPHAGEPCRGDRLELVGGVGTSVESAAGWLRTIQDQYAAANPTCWQRIQQAAQAPFSTIVVTTEPLGSVEHGGMTPAIGRLYHLDGLHRLLGWALANRLSPGASVPAIIAGKTG